MFIILALFFLGAIDCYGKTDTLVVSNGDKIIGEIKEMQRGVLIIETDYSDSDFKIEWDKVRKFYSENTFLIYLSNRSHYIATMRTNRNDKTKIIISNEEVHISVALISIVDITPIDDTFWDRFSASLDMGFSLTKANNLNQFTMNGNFGYLAESWNARASFNVVRSSQDSVAETKRTDASLGGRYLMIKSWFATMSVDLLQNDEQKLQLRTTPKLGIGNYFIQSNSINFSFTAGVALNKEEFTDPEQEDRKSSEGFVGLEFDMFDMGDLNLFTNITAYPSFTEEDRLRVDFTINIKFDFLDDFYFKIGYTHNFDNQPVEGASEVDYVFQTTFGWDL